MPLKGTSMTKEQKEKIRLAHLGRKRLPFSVQAKANMSKAHLGKPHPNKSHAVTEQTKEKISLSKLGIPRSDETKRKISESLSGSNHPYYGRKRSPETRRKLGESRKGEKSHFWRGGINKENLTIRGSLEYALWRESVYERDNYTCQFCLKIGGKLNADHIKPFATYPELRFDLSNGRTLCVSCHKNTDTYGKRSVVSPEINP